MPIPKRIAARLLAALLLLAAAPAALPAQETPEAVAGRFLETLRAGDWAANAALMHPEAVGSFKRLFVELGGDHPEVVDELLGMKLADLQAMPPAQAYEAFMRKFVGPLAELRQMIVGMRVEMLGHVAEGADLAHVVYRMRMETDGVSMSKVEVVPLRRDGAGWKVLLTADLENLAAALKEQFH